MSIKSDMFSKFMGSLENTTNSAYDLATTAVTQAGKEKQRKEQNDQLIKSDQDVLVSLYTKELGEKLKTLPDSIDIDSYGPEMDKFSNDFVSARRNEGIYREESLEWLENSFIPSQKAQNEASVGEIQNYVTNSWLATRASSKASELAANPDMTVDQAYEEYRAYYESTRLANIPSGYGILLPETFRETIRGTKAVQSFEKISSNPENGYLFSSGYDMNKAMEQAMSESGYNPNAVERAKFMSDCNAALSKIETAVKNSVSAFCDQIEGQYNEFSLTPEFDSTMFDLKDAYDAVKGYPPQYIGKFVDLAAKIEGHNADVQYNVATSLINKGVIDDTVLDMLDAGYKSTHAEKFKTARNDAVKQKIISTARLNGNNDAGQVLGYILGGDVGITVTDQERFEAAKDFVAGIKGAYDTISDYDTLALKIQEDKLAGSPVPDILSALYDVKVTYPTTTEGGGTIQRTETESVDEVVEGKVPEGATIEFKPKFDFTFKPSGENVPLAEKRIGDEPSGNVVATEAQPQQAAEGKKTEQKPNLPVVPMQTSSFAKESDIPTVFTGNALDKATNAATSASTGNAQVNNVEAQEEVKDLLRKGAPQEVINAIVYYHEKKGNLSEEWISANYNQKGWRENRRWGLIEQRIEDLSADIDISSSTLDDVKERVTEQIVNAFRYSGQTWEEFEKTSLVKLSDMLYSQEMLAESMTKLEVFNQISQNANSYYETMTSNGLYGQLFQDYASGKFDAIVDHGMIQKVQDMNLVGNDKIRDEFAKMMGHSSFEEASETDPTGMTKLMIETMTAVVNMHNEAGEFYGHVVDRLKENGIDAELLGFTIDKDLGYVFFDSNTVARGYALCIDPELMVYDVDSGVSAQWKYVPCSRGSDGRYIAEKDWGYGDMGAYATVGSNLFVSTVEKPSEKKMTREQRGKEITEAAEQSMLEVGTNAANIGAQLRGLLMQLFGRAQTKKYRKQTENEESTFIEAYKTAFIPQED